MRKKDGSIDKMYSVARWVALMNINSFNTISLELETYREGYGSQSKEPPSSESHIYVYCSFYCNCNFNIY